VIADYFAGTSVFVPERWKAQDGATLREWLEVMREQGVHDVDATKKGDCLIFWRRNWHLEVSKEVPERLLLPYLQYLRNPETISQQDLAALARSLSGTTYSRMPADDDSDRVRLESAGDFHVSAFDLFAALPKEQQARALGEGVPLTEMTPDRRAEAERLARLLDPCVELTDDASFSVEVGVGAVMVGGYFFVQPRIIDGSEWLSAQAEFILPVPDAYPLALREDAIADVIWEVGASGE
jgi:hypothetical protein